VSKELAFALFQSSLHKSSHIYSSDKHDKLLFLVVLWKKNIDWLEERADREGGFEVGCPLERLSRLAGALSL